MTWKDRLQDASFRGVPFKVEEESAGPILRHSITPQ